MTWAKFIELTKRLFGAKQGEILMAKEDVVAVGLKAIQDGEVQVYTDALGGAYDGGFADGVASVPVAPSGFTQGDIDAAVQAKVDADAVVLAQAQADDKKAFDDAQAVSAQAVADLEAKFDALVLKEGQEAGVIAGLQDSLQKIKDAEAILAGLFPAPVPPLDPAPAA
jgi:hypothetical protein